MTKIGLVGPMLAALLPVVVAIGSADPAPPLNGRIGAASKPDPFEGLPADSSRFVAVALCEGREPSLSPDGRFVAFGGWSDVFLYDLQTGTTRTLCQANIIVDLAWNPTGTQLAFTSSSRGGYNNTWVVNADGSELHKLDDAGVDDQHPVWSPDGKSIVWTRENRLWQVGLDGTGGHFLTRTPTRFHLEFARGWARDKVHLLYMAGSEMGEEFRLRVVGLDSTDDVADSSRIPVVTRSEVGVAEGGELLFRGKDNSIEFVERGANGRIRRCFLQTSAFVWSLCLARDRSVAVFGDEDQDDPRIWLVKLRP